MQWDFEIIQVLIREAEEKGESIVELSSPREAYLFRSAINNNRRLKNLGQDLTTKVQGRTVTISRRPQIKRLEILTEPKIVSGEVMEI